MTRDVRTRTSPARTRTRHPFSLLCALALGLWIPTAGAAPTFDPNAPNQRLAPGSVLRIHVAPGTGQGTDTSYDAQERLLRATWTEGGGATQRSRMLAASGDDVDYQVPTAAQHCSSLSDRLSVDWQSCSGEQCSTGRPVTNPIQVTVIDPLVLSPGSSSISGAPGSTQRVGLNLSGGAAPYRVTSSANATVSLSDGVLSYAIPASATSSYSDTLTLAGASSGDACGGNSATLLLRVDVVASGAGLSASPSAIALQAVSLSGAAQEVSKTFSVSGGTPPYRLSVSAVSGGLVGRVQPGQLSAPGSATYSVTIPADAPANLQFVNRVLVTDATGASTSVTVEANVNAADPLSGRPDLTPNQRSVAEAIETVCPRLAGMAHRNADQEDLFTQCSAMLGNASAAGIPNTLEQITNDKANAAKSAGMETGTQQLTNVGARLAALRSGSKGFDISALSINMDGSNVSGNRLAALLVPGLSGGGASADQGDVFGRWGFFLNGTVNLGNRDTTRNEKGFDYDSVGVTAGADYRFSSSFVAGAAFGYGVNNVDYDANGGGLDTATWHLAAYATKSLSDNFYVEGVIEYGWNDYDSTRNLSYQITPGLDPVARRAKADYGGSQFGASLGAGYDLSQGAFSYGVYGRVGYLDVRVDDIREQNAGGLNLVIDGFDATSVTSVLGARISRAFTTSRAVLVPQARFEWEHEYDDDASTISARFAADPTATNFAIATDDPDRDYFRLGIGLSAVFPHGVSSFVNYNALLDKRDWTDHMIDAGVRVEFY